jgi:hypothetical protein
LRRGSALVSDYVVEGRHCWRSYRKQHVYPSHDRATVGCVKSVSISQSIQRMSSEK